MESLILSLDKLSKDSLRKLAAKLIEEGGEDAVKVANQQISDMNTPSQIVVQSSAGGAKQKGKGGKRGKAGAKPFDMSRYHQRDVALQIQYDGRPYYGFASQIGDCEETVEKHVFDTLIKLRLITDRKDCGYTRCGRTDRGVSALGQVVCMRLRSGLPIGLERSDVPKHPNDVYIKQIEKKDADDNENEDGKEVKEKEFMEIDYCELINKNLPEGIRALGWSEVTPEFDARFSASYRQYRYFFTKKDLDIPSMQKAASLLLGEHDFRNFCKMNITEVSNFRREIYHANILLFSEDAQDESRNVYMMEIRGIAFLWHMVRCIMAVLFLVGEGREGPDAITNLLDIEKTTHKPQYNMASEEPLVLHECGYDNLNIQWQPKTLWTLVEHFEAQYDRHTVAAAQCLNSIRFLKSKLVRECDLQSFSDDIEKDMPGAKEEKAQFHSTSEGGPKKRRKSNEDIEKVVNVSGEKISWGNALEVLASRGIIYPFPTVTNLGFSGSTAKHNKLAQYGGLAKLKYVPLTERATCEAYEERVANLHGPRKEKLDKHLELKDSRDNKEFFNRLRAQGTIE